MFGHSGCHRVGVRFCVSQVILFALVFLADPRGTFAADCNANGIEDREDIELGTSSDCESNGLPDECDDYPPCEAAR